MAAVISRVNTGRIVKIMYNYKFVQRNEQNVK